MIRRASRRVLGPLASAVDRMVTLAVASRPGTPGVLDTLSDQRLGELRDAYRVHQTTFFRPPRPIAPTLVTRSHETGGKRVLDLAWSSDYVPLLTEAHTLFEQHAANRVACARLFTGAQPRAAIVLIHGYLAGNFAFEERVWPIRRFDALGYDVVLFSLPFHGLRETVGHVGPPPFPGFDPLSVNEGFRQAAGDLLDLVSWLKERGHSKVGVMGMSLGGYTAALAATLTSELAFLVPVVPLACLAAFAQEQRQRTDRPLAARRHDLLREVYAPVSPLARAPRIASERVLVVGGKADRITPVSHARRLATHFSAPLAAWQGGHLLQVGRRDAFERVERLLESVLRGQ